MMGGLSKEKCLNRVSPYFPGGHGSTDKNTIMLCTFQVSKEADMKLDFRIKDTTNL